VEPAARQSAEATGAGGSGASSWAAASSPCAICWLRRIPACARARSWPPMASAGQCR